MSNLMLLSGYSNSSTVWDGTIGSPDPALMKSGSTVYTVGGRAVYRHISDKGSVIQWVDKSSVVHKTLVLDAAYRNGSKIWGSDALPTGMTEYKNSYYYIGSGTTSKNSSYDTTSEVSANSSYFTDTIINARSTYFEDANTSKYNTDKIIAYWPNGSYAAHWCRSNGSGITADLPNIQTLVRIYLCAEKIDTLDPTVSANTALVLSGWMSNSYTWSSTLEEYSHFEYYDEDEDTNIDYYYGLSWGIDYDGTVGSINQPSYSGVAPSLDL